MVPLIRSCLSTYELYREWLIQWLPQWARFSIDGAARHLGLWFGPEAQDKQWEAVDAGAGQWADLIASAHEGFNASMAKYAKRVSPLVGFVGQLSSLSCARSACRRSRHGAPW